MSNQNYELFFDELQQLRQLDKSLDQLIDESVLNDTKKINWILEKCVEFNDTSTIKYLVTRGITLGVLNEENQTAIHVAAYKGSFETMNFLFSYYDNSVNCVDNNGLSHLHVACIAGNTGVVENLLKCSIDVNSGFEDHGRIRTPLYLAARFQRPKIVNLLLKNKADPSPLFNFNIATTKSLFYSVCHNNEKNKKDVIHLACIEIACGKLMNNLSSSSFTLLYYLCKNSYLDDLDSVFNRFVCKCCINIKTVHEFKRSYRHKVEFLLNNGCDVRRANGNGDTLLHLAIREINEFRQLKLLEVVNLQVNKDIDIPLKLIIKFLEYGADVNAKNNKGQTPLQLAINQLSFEVVKILLDYNADFSDIQFDRLDFDEKYLITLKATDNLFKILEALEDKGFHINRRQNLDIIKFFVGNNLEYLKTLKRQFQADFLSKIRNLLEFGTSSNIKEGEDILINVKEPYYGRTIVYGLSNKRYALLAMEIRQYLSIVQTNQLYVSKDTRDFLYHLASDVDESSNDSDSEVKKQIFLFIQNEIKFMKTTKLNAFTTIYDILKKRPQLCYLRIMNCNYMSILNSEASRRKFRRTLGIIEGHFTKSLIRGYIVESAREYLTDLINFPLPYLCCNIIIDHLSNEDLLMLALAAVEDC